MAEFAPFFFLCLIFWGAVSAIIGWGVSRYARKMKKRSDRKFADKIERFPRDIR